MIFCYFSKNSAVFPGSILIVHFSFSIFKSNVIVFSTNINLKNVESKKSHFLSRRNQTVTFSNLSSEKKWWTEFSYEITVGLDYSLPSFEQSLKKFTFYLSWKKCNFVNWVHLQRKHNFILYLCFSFFILVHKHRYKQKDVRVEVW